MESTIRPKLIFFRFKYDQTLADFVLLHRQQHVKCLSEFFDVTVVNEDCDYQQVCDQYEPDLTLFESGVNNTDIHRLNIRNTHAHPGIPKIGLHNGDSWCEAREGFLSDMEQWGIGTFFSISTTIAAHMPEITENLFVWSNFIDADIHRDYKLPKTTPVLITGGVSPLYPWRQKVNKTLTQHFPTLICPHGGYTRSTQLMFYGEQYARLINTSYFAPTCGTLAKEVLRKHFEIPASKACLVTEKSSALEAAGFIDMHNCVFADEQNVLDKLDYLFSEQDRLERIIDAGYELVHSCHTLKQRDQMFQWFDLHKKLRTNQKITQSNPFGPLKIVEKSSRANSISFAFDGSDLSLMHEGDRKFWAGKYEEAENLYIKCFNHMSRKPEIKFKLALCSLHKGDAKMALDWIAQPIQYTLGVYKASSPDPVEWAYLVVSLLCLGKLDEAQQHINHFPMLSHPELNRTRWVVNLLKYGEETVHLMQDEDRKDQSKCHYSIHQFPPTNFNEWIERLYRMLRACGQPEWAENLICAIDLRTKDSKTLENEPLKSLQTFCSERSKNSFCFLHRIWYPLHLSFFRRLLFLQFRKKLKLKPKILSFLNAVESKLGCFLPYSLSIMRNDEFFHMAHKLAEEEGVKNALIIGASAGKGSTEALINCIHSKQNSINVFCVNAVRPQFIQLKKVHSRNSLVKFYTLQSSLHAQASDELQDIINSIKKENQIVTFDLVLIDGSEFDFSVDLDAEISGVKYIFLYNISTLQHHKNHTKLLMDPSYVLICQNLCSPSSHSDYSIFQKASTNV